MKIVKQFLFCCFFVGTLHAQDVHFSSLTTNEGLSSNTVYCSFKDHLGFLWIGTLDGLNRYDGNKFIVYRHSFSDSTSIASNIVFSITEDSIGNIWLATATGISCWSRSSNGFKNFFFKPQGQIQSVPLAKIFLQADGNIYAYSIASTGTLYVFNKKSNELAVADFMDRKKTETKGRIFWCNPGQTGIVADSSLWVYNFRSRLFEEWIYPSNIGEHSSLQSFNVLAVQRDSIWFSLWSVHDWRIFSRSNNQWTTKEFTDLPAQTHFTFLVPFDKAHWWISAFSMGMIDYSPVENKVALYQNDPSKNGSWKGTITFDYYVDDDHTIWFATNQGLNFIAQPSFSYHFLEKEIKEKSNLPVSKISCMALDNQNSLWIGLLDYGAKENGLLRYFPSENLLTSILNDASGDHYSANLIWNILPLDSVVIVSNQIGTMQYNLKTKQFEKLSESHAPAEVCSLKYGLATSYRDQSNHLWFAPIRRGVYRFDPSTKSTEHFYLESEDSSKRLSSTNLNEMEEDPFHHNMWIICSDDNKLNCIDEQNHVTIFPILIHGSELDKTLSCLTTDSSGNVWMGTLDNGIIFFDAQTKKCSQISAADGLPSQTIYECKSDKKNKIWVYTAKGLASIDAKTKVITSFFDNNLPAQFNFEQGPMIISDDGTVYVGTGPHLISVNTKTLGVEKNPGVPIVTGISTEDSAKILSAKNFYVIHPDEAYLTVQFVTPDLSRGKQVQYSYQLTGYDPDWVNTGNTGEVHFNQIPPGNYQLKLRAQLAGQLWNGEFSSVDFQILPAYYQTWWFKLLMVFLGAIFLAAVLIAYFSRRIARLKREQQVQSIRTRIAQDIHDDIGSGLTKIFMQSEMSSSPQRNISDEMKTTLQSISDQSRELVGKLGEVVWSANPAHDDLDSMLAYFRSYVHHFMNGLSFQYEILFPEKISSIAVNPDVRRNLFLILKEALNNCVKYSKAEHVQVFFLQKENEYEMKITDDGVGINSSEVVSVMSGNGIKNMKSRADAMNAEIAFRSNEPHGVIISVKGKLKD